MTVSDIKQTHLSEIYNLIYHAERISKGEIVQQLKLSLPTVSKKLKTLEERQLIVKSGYIESNVGRKAMGYVLCSEAKISIGVAIFKEYFDIAIVNLKGEILSENRYNITFEKADPYYMQVSHWVKDFILSQNFRTDQILGVGFSFQGNTNRDRTKVIYDKSLDMFDIKIENFSQFLNLPCLFFDNAKAAATTEIWHDQTIRNAFYLCISDHMGGALINEFEVVLGDNGHCGAIEHVQLSRSDTDCYCGRPGCVGTYCCITSLLEDQENIATFLKKVRSGETNATERWDIFLKSLSFAIYNLHILLDRKIIIGGKISSYLTEQDMKKIKTFIYDNPLSQTNDFVVVSACKGNPSLLGAAIYYTQKFLKTI